MDFVFSSADLTLTIDEFSDRYLKPAVSVLATAMEADALNMINDIPYVVDDNALPISYKDIALARKILNLNLAPDDGDRVGIISSQHVPSYLDAIKGLFNPQEGIARPYLTGKIGKVNNMNFYENTVIPYFQSGTAAAVTGYTVNGGANVGSTVVVAAGANTFKKGDVVTFPGCFAVNPETKANMGYLQQFTVTADYAGGAGNLPIFPAIVVTGAAQNVTGSPTAAGAVAKLGGGANALYAQSVLFHPEAFAFVTADLIDVSKFGAWGSRQVMDGISMRIARQYNITSDTIPTRIDVIYGYKTLRQQLACRIIAQ